MGTRMETKTQFVPGGICALELVVAGLGAPGTTVIFDHLSTNCGVSEDRSIIQTSLVLCGDRNTW